MKAGGAGSQEREERKSDETDEITRNIEGRGKHKKHWRINSHCYNTSITVQVYCNCNSGICVLLVFTTHFIQLRLGALTNLVHFLRVTDDVICVTEPTARGFPTALSTPHIFTDGFSNLNPTLYLFITQW